MHNIFKCVWKYWRVTKSKTELEQIHPLKGGNNTERNLQVLV